MDAMVFEGPVSKKFKLRILYEEDQNGLIIRAIQSAPMVQVRGIFLRKKKVYSAHLRDYREYPLNNHSLLLPLQSWIQEHPEIRAQSPLALQFPNKREHNRFA